MESRDGSRLARALATDADDAFPALLAAYGRAVYTLMVRLCGSADAEDAAQDAFLRTYRALKACPPADIAALRLRPWVLTIALNVARNRRRTAARRPHIADGQPLAEHADGAEPPDAAPERAELRASLARALARLPTSAREAVVLRHVVGCPLAEVAAILRRPPGTVKSQVSRGLAALRADPALVAGIPREASS